MTPVELREAYRECRKLTRRHGTTYYWATQLLPADKRPHVQALYGFCRHADDVVDALDGTPLAARADALRALGDELRAALADPAAPASVPVVAAVAHTARAYGIDEGCFDRFLRSMAMDLTVATYDTWDDLCAYMDGSAAVIGEMMLPILEPTSPDALGPARDLGLAFQLTNFLRDVGEDLDRGRVYLPADDLARFDADPRARSVTPEWEAVMRFEIDRARALYLSADAGIALLPPRSARAIATARHLYSRILDAIEANGYDVFGRRARVSTARKVAVAARHLAPRATRRRAAARRGTGSTPPRRRSPFEPG